MDSRYSKFGFLKLAFQLRPSYLIGFLVLWVILGSIGAHLNAGLGPIKTVGSAVVLLIVGLLLSAVTVGPLYSDRIRQLALREEVKISDVRLGLFACALFGL